MLSSCHTTQSPGRAGVCRHLSGFGTFTAIALNRQRFKNAVLCPIIDKGPGAFFFRAGVNRKELAVTGKQEKKETRVAPPPKRYWHLYSLQSLQAHKLTEIVNKILRREYVLIK